MPRTHRDLIKRQMGHAYRNITTAMGHLANVEAEFTPQHPEFGEALQVAIVALDSVRTLLNNFAKEAWGREDMNWEAYSDLPQTTKEIAKKQLDTNYYNPRGVKPKKIDSNGNG